MTIKTVLLAGTVALMPPAAQAQWEESLEIDRITGETLSAGIWSPMTLADKPRPYPFHFVIGRLYLGCGTGVIFAFDNGNSFGVVEYDAIEFSNLQELPIRARVDDRVVEFWAKNPQDGEDPFLGFLGTDNDSLYSAIVNSGKLLLEIPTVEYGEVYFSFDLAGTRDLHDRTCGNEQAN